MPPAETPPAAGGGSFLTRKVGPIPTWGYLVLAGGVVVFVWWRNRSQGQAADTATTPGASAAGDSSAVPTTDYGQGFDYGYQAGFNATGTGMTGSSDSDTDTAPAAHHGRLCFKATDPSGQERTVCDFGHWVRRSGRWHWHQGPARDAAHAATQTGSKEVPGHVVHPPNRLHAIPQGQPVHYVAP